MPPSSKPCTKCGVDKPLSGYSAASRGKYGRKATCKDCDAVRHAAQFIPRPRRPRREPFAMDSLKQCRGCKETKPLTEFSLARRATETSNDTYLSQCKECRSARARDWFADNRERAKENRHRWALGNNYGITPDDYQRILAEQGGVCAICGEDEPNAHGRTGTKFRLSVDHCHKTGRVRGLLCQKCNRAIGLLNDDAARLRAAIGYLEKEGESIVEGDRPRVVRTLSRR